MRRVAAFYPRTLSNLHVGLGVVLTLWWFASTPAFADEGGQGSAVVPPPRPSMVVLDLGQHVLGVGYQRSMTPWFAAQLAADYYQPWTQNDDFLGLSGEAYKGGDLRGMILRARVFFFPFGRAPEGLWISPFAQAGVGWGLRHGERVPGPVSAAGMTVGYSVFLTDAIVLGGGFGLQYHAARIPGGDGPPRFSRYYPQLDIQLGYAF